MKYWIRWSLLMFFAGCCAGECSADAHSASVVRLHVTGEATAGDGTAFCVGEATNGRAVFLTARHNFRGASSGQIYHSGKWHTISDVNEHPSADVASFEAAVTARPLQLATAGRLGEVVTIPGFGPEYHGRTASSFTGVLESECVAGRDGLHPIPGDSGAPVVQAGTEVVGVIRGYDTPYNETVFRSDWSEQRLATRFTGLREIRECLQQCYPRSQCPPGGCRIWIRNEYRQPIGFLGLPVGPPHRVQVAEPVPRVFVPEDQQQARQNPEPVSVQGPQGPAGPEGQPGRDGRSVSAQEVESIVNAWLDANRESLVGPQGPPGPPGQSGSPANVTRLEGRLTVLEQRPFRIILSNDGKIVDDETYNVNAGEPVVLDLKKLISK